MFRRQFLRRVGQYALVAGGTVLLPRRVDAASLAEQEDAQTEKLTILHTNDVHSRIEPFPMDGGKNQGTGGIARRAALIDKIRQEEENVLLLDAGDMFQGTPYFNYFGGELEIKLMSQMGYDGGTIGNHDFDAGIDNLKKQITGHASFPLINANYDFSNTVMEGHVSPYKIYQKGKMKIGVTGVGVELDGLVPAPLFLETKYNNPIEKAEFYASYLKNEEKCDFVICLSHLGYSYESNKVSDLVLAAETENIDLILGGHTHTLLETPTTVENKAGREVFVSQAYWAGIILGRIDIHFMRGNKQKIIQANNTKVEKS